MNKILIVVDMQNDFIDGSLGTVAAKAIVPNVVNKIKNWDGYIIATKDTHDSDYLNTKEGTMLPIKHCIKNTNGWAMNLKVSEAIIEHGKYLGSVEKETFGSIDLLSKLETVFENLNEGCFIDPPAEFTLIGLCTDICVISNAMLIKAYFPNSEIIIDSSCCAGTTPENHDNALKAMQCCHINII